MLLEGSKLAKYFGGLGALKGVDFFVDEKEIVGLIGPNGAGKTTLLNCICGVYPFEGTVRFERVKINGMKPHKICKMGIGRTYQIPRPFLNMTVSENIRVCGETLATKCVEFVGLTEKKNVLAKNLTFHERRLLEIARALALGPKILLLDECAAGLNPVEVSELMKLIDAIRSDIGIAIFWVEHVMKAVMGTCDRIIVLEDGRKIAEGKPESIAGNEDVIRAYLGEKYVLGAEKTR